MEHSEMRESAGLSNKEMLEWMFSLLAPSLSSSRLFLWSASLPMHLSGLGCALTEG